MHMLPGTAPGGRPTPVLHLHRTAYRYDGPASPTDPGGMALIYKDLIASSDRNRQVTADVAAAYAGRILRPYPGKETAEVHDYHDKPTGVLASSLAKRAPGYTSLGFPDPRKLPYTPSASTARLAQPEGPVA